MSIVSWLLKPKSDMAKENTPCVKLGKYTLTSHAQNRVADPTRKTRKRDVIDNLFTRPHAITKTKTDSRGRPSYNRIGKRITTSINPRNKNVVSLNLRAFHKQIILFSVSRYRGIQFENLQMAFLKSCEFLKE